MSTTAKLPKLQDKQFATSQEAFEYACQLRGYNPAEVIPKGMESMPEWLRTYTTATIARLIIAEAINEGRKPLLDGTEDTYEPYFRIKKTDSGFGFSHSSTCYWYASTCVGARLKFFKDKDARYFAENFTDLHMAVMINI